MKSKQQKYNESRYKMKANYHPDNVYSLSNADRCLMFALCSFIGFELYQRKK